MTNSKQSPFREFHKYKVTDMKNHNMRHPKHIHGHHCPSWWGQFICFDCDEYKYCECIDKIKHIPNHGKTTLEI